MPFVKKSRGALARNSQAHLAFKQIKGAKFGEGLLDQYLYAQRMIRAKNFIGGCQRPRKKDTRLGGIARNQVIGARALLSDLAHALSNRSHNAPRIIRWHARTVFISF